MHPLHRLIVLLLLMPLFALTSQAQTPRPEYPRPQFQRTDWINLNGTWTYAFDFGRSGKAKGWADSHGFDANITVPFCPESRLSGVAHTDFINTIWYQRTITVPEAWAGKNILLHFGAVDYEAHIYIDGHRVMTHYGAGSSFEVDITRYVTPGRPANLVLCVNDNLRDGKQPGGKQCTALYSEGCSYTRTTGIWQTVWMEPVSTGALKSVFATPDIDQQQLVVRPELWAESNRHKLTVQVFDGTKKVAERTAPATSGTMMVLPIKNPKLWSPESPFLYDVIYTVRDAEGRVIDTVTSYAGMRKVHVEGGYFYLNNQPYFQRLVLDQGFYPEGVWTAPSDADLKRDIELAKQVGFNGARLHQKVFEERYFYWADHLGYLTWAEQANWCLDSNDNEAARNFIAEWTEELYRDRNHPSIVTWTPFNETWDCREGNYERFIRDVYDITKAIDPTRPVNDASGDGHIKTDIWSVHDYTREPEHIVANHTIRSGVEPYRNQGDKKFLARFNGQPYMVDEFGGLPWIPEAERANSWGYGEQINSLEDFYRILEAEVDAFMQCKYVVGVCYTQFTDVEQEKNGIYRYDRTPKFDTERIRKIFEKMPSVITNVQPLDDWR